MNLRIIFCDNLIDRKIDPDFEEEYRAAVAHDIPVSLLSFEDLNQSNITKSIARIKGAEEDALAIYRGWMLEPDRYALLYQGLLEKKIRLLNTPEEYMTCHYLPASYDFIKAMTPLTVWKESLVVDFDDVFKLIAVFDNAPIIVKDYVKSQKHHWAEACFIPMHPTKMLCARLFPDLLSCRDHP
jgi:hypothetical protein